MSKDDYGTAWRTLSDEHALEHHKQAKEHTAKLLNVPGDVSPQDHEIEKAYMAKERQAIVGWLRHLGAETEPLALLIENGQHWKDQP